MLKRKAISALRAWKEKRDRLPLIIEGARQVGKTFAVRAFAGEAYTCFYELNFLEDKRLSGIFEGSLDGDSILNSIRLSFPHIRFIPGKALVFLDEIQACPQALTALKFLSGDSRFDVIASGSALGMLHGRVASWPVGQVEYLDMFSLDFEEFLWALGIGEDLVHSVAAYRSGARSIPVAVHETMMRCLRQYLVVGGMPDAVNAFLPDRDLLAADAVQRRIYRDYQADIAHYAEPEIRLKAQRCWESIPLQLMKPNHKFQYAAVEPRGNAQKFASSVEWLTASGMAYRVQNVSQVQYPLRAFEQPESFRLYPCDIGLLVAAFDFSLKQALLATETANSPTESVILRTAKGGIYEALAAEILAKRGFRNLHFYRNTPGTVEMEFLLEGENGVIPLEIKAGKNKTRSLDTLLQSPDIRTGYKFADQNVGQSGKKITLPLYLLMFF